MERELRVWRMVSFAAVAALAFALGRGAAAPAEAGSLLLNASHIGTNEDGDVLWLYDFDGANREWIVTRIDYQKGSSELKTIPQPRERRTN